MTSSSSLLFPLASSIPCPRPPLPPVHAQPGLLDAVFASAGRRAVIVVSLDAVSHNISTLRALAPGAELMAVVKGAAYGSGIMGVARTALEGGAKELAVATVSEGVHLRREGITVPITVLGNLNAEEVADVTAHRLCPTVSWSHCLETCDRESLRYKDGSPMEVQVEVDTGMSRYGVQPEDLAQLMDAIAKAGAKVRALYTHFQASISRPDLNKKQLDMFLEATKPFPNIPRHAAATTGAVQGLGTDLELIRPGGAITGLSSGSSVEDTEAFAKCGFQPAFSVLARPSFVKLLPPGRGVGYDATYTSKEDEWIVNFSTGWSDGMARKLTNSGQVLRIKTGQLCPIVGRVSMDSITVRVPEEPSADEVFAIVTADYHPSTSAVGVARSLGAAVYEVPGNWSTRLPRVMVQAGAVKEVYHSVAYTN